MKLRIFTFVYGRYFEWFDRTVASLMWPLNRKALDGAVWSVYTNEGGESSVEKALSQTGLKVEISRVHVENNIGKQLSLCLQGELQKCVDTGAALFLAPPDTVFGEGTVETLVNLGSEGQNAISVPHPRVFSDTFPELKEPTSNAKLVSLAMENMHEVWQLANIKLPKNNAYTSGAGWRQVGEKLYAVTMRIPTPYLINPAARDVETLAASGPGGWDHKWPANLVKEQRHRIVGSSDAAFMVELSPRDLPQGETRDRNRTEPDAYRGDLPHHHVNRNTVTIWRAE